MNRSLRKSWLLTVLLFVATLMLSASAWSQSVATEQPAAGIGSSANPYQIANAAQLAWFRDRVNGTYTPADGETATKHDDVCAKLIADIDMSTVCSESLGTWEPISRRDLTINWRGTFDGDGHTISNLYVNWSQSDAGLFGYVSGSTIRNIRLTGVSITGTDIYTGVIGRCFGSAIDVTVEDGTISGASATGGIVGFLSGTISHCTNRAQVTATSRNVGGICGSSKGTIEFCTNYATVKTTTEFLGGITGYQQGGSISNCANHGDLEAGNSVGGIVGRMTQPGSISNAISTGNVTETNDMQESGLLVGTVLSDLTLSDYVVFRSDATLTISGTVQAPRGIGNLSTLKTGRVSGETAGYTTAELQSGMVTYLLQSAAPESTWGQQIGTDNYPQLGSAHTVYAEGNISITCTGVISGGSFSNTRPETEATVTFSHGTVTRHDAVEKTCFADGNVEYWECDLCHRYFTDEALTVVSFDPVVKSTGHSFDYATGVCTVCGEAIPTLGTGTHTIQITAVTGEQDMLNGYNLYRFVAPDDGELTVTTAGASDTYGTLWSGDASTLLTYDDNNGEESNFLYTYNVTKGTVYYIGVRRFGGAAIEGDYILTISGTWRTDVETLTLADGEEYTFAQNVTNFTYTRSFSHTYWQPLYVPFAMKSADWTAQGLEVACINNFHEYEEADGSAKVVIEVKKVTSGTLRPNTPYLIRALEAGDKTITLSNVALAEPESATIDCSSVTRLYTFKGIYSWKGDFNAANDYTMTDGNLYHPEGTLKPQRWYLTVSSRGDIIDEESAGATPRVIAVSVIGEGEVTGIEDIRIVTSAPRQGIYDLLGRRLAEEPRSGVFIKDGKKVVR